MRVVLFMLLGATCFLTAPFPATASPASKNCQFGCPLAADQLPHPPAFTPKSGDATVLQRFIVGDWFYKVCYIYGAPGSKTPPGWTLAGMVATRIRLPGSLYPRKTSEALHKNFVTANASGKDLPCHLPENATKAAGPNNKPHI